MNIQNDTPFEVAALPGIGPEMGPVFTLVVKGTFDIQTGGKSSTAEEQLPIAYGDEPCGSGEGIRMEADTAPFKPRADVVVAGSARVPGGQPAPYLDVGLRVGDRRCGIRVFGDRVWEKESRASKPVPFTEMELSAARSFGGVSPSGGFCEENPDGKGFLVIGKKESGKGAPLANVEEIERPVRTWNDHPKPVGFGVYPRAAQPRASFLGTYDEAWRENRSPLPPEDFRFDYYNCAFPALQFDGYLRGDEEIELVHMSKEPRVAFALPGIAPQAVVKRFPPDTPGVAGGGGKEQVQPAGPPIEEVPLVLDTVVVMPDEGVCSLVWRGICRVADLEVPEVEEITIALPGEPPSTAV